MKRSKNKIFLLSFASIIIISIFLISCKKTDYPLLDPSTAGVWTLYNTSNGLPSNQVRDLVKDKQNNLWAAFSGNGIGLCQQGNWTYFNTSNSSILSNSVTSLAATPDGGLLVGTANGIAFRSAAGGWSSYKDPAVSTMRINTIKVASDNSVWLGTENAGFYFDIGTGYTQIYNSTYKNVNAIEQDSQGSIFLGTDNGLLKWNGTAWSFYTTADGLPDNSVTALFLDSKKRLWIGTDGGETVAWIDKNGYMHQLSLMNGTSGTYVRDIFEDRKGDIWFATWFDGLIRFDGVVPHSFKLYDGFYENDVNCLAEDEYGAMWFGLYSNGLVKYTLPLN